MRKKEAFKRLINLSLVGICLVLETLIYTYFFINHFYGSLADGIKFWQRGYMLQIFFYFALLFFFSNMYGGLRLGYLKNTELIFSQVFATLMVNLFTYAQLSLMANQAFVPTFFILMMIVQALAVILWINIANQLYQRMFPPKKLLLIHGDRSIEDIKNKFASRKDKYTIVNCMHVGLGVEKLSKEIVKGYENGDYSGVVLWDISVEDRNKLLKFCPFDQSIYYAQASGCDPVRRRGAAFV